MLVNSSMLFRALQQHANWSDMANQWLTDMADHVTLTWHTIGRPVPLVQRHPNSALYLSAAFGHTQTVCCARHLLGCIFWQ